MITRNTLLKHAIQRIPKVIISLMDSDEISLVINETLETFSEFYPKKVKRVYITEQDAFPEWDDLTEQKLYSVYKIPKKDKRYVYTDVSIFRHPANRPITTKRGIGGKMANDLLSTGEPGMAGVSLTGSFEAPDNIILDPPLSYHIDFSVVMNRLPYLSEIQWGYRSTFLNLWILHLKRYIYNTYQNIADGGEFAGVDMSTKIDNYSSADDDIATLLETLESDWFLDPEAIDEMMETAGITITN